MKKPWIVIGLLGGMTLLGTLGFRFFEDRTWVESLYLSVITLATVGSRDPARNDQEMIFVVIYLIFGLGAYSYALFTLGQLIVDAQFNQMWEKGRMEKRINQLNEHYIVIGLGRMGTSICEYLHSRKKPFVVIDRDDKLLEQYGEAHRWIYLTGDATDDDILQKAGIDRAKALACVLPSDADNTYVVLSARILNSSMQIISRASDDKAIRKITQAGASRVISPFSSGGIKMARFMINPLFEDFLEIADDNGIDMELADYLISHDSPYVGKMLLETDIRTRGLMVIGIRKTDGSKQMAPPSSTILDAGDKLFVIGSSSALQEILTDMLPVS